SSDGCTSDLTIANNAVTSAKIAANTIVDADIASGDFNNITGIGTQAQALDMGTNAISGVTSLTLNGAISGGTTVTGSGNFNSTGGALQTTEAHPATIQSGIAIITTLPLS